MSEPVRVRCYVGLGSNLDDPAAQLRQALDELDRLPATRRVAASALHRSRPLGPADQPDFVNAVAALDTALAPLELLDALQALERAHGRAPGRRWGPRPLDLDLLLYDGLEYRDARLELPHPGLTSRDFVLYPLAEIAPATLVIPGHGRLEELLERCPRQHLTDPA